jgi:FkbM family methyltransferase
MTTISYAQNYEDVMLLRALRSVQRGFYIDVGAQHPVLDSVTKSFYEKGWRGINIEPVTQWFELVVQDRPEDINLQIAISSTSKELSIFEVVDTGLSTTTERYADRHEAAGHPVERHTVACRSLDDIIAEYGIDDIHFLKVDVEGAEDSVMESISLDRHRPWIMVIEATEPNSQQPAYADWEPRVLANGYDMVYEDGLNRFYVAKEHAELKAAFRLPPNYFDFFMPYDEWHAKNELGTLTRAHLAMAGKLQMFEAERDELKAERGELQAERSELKVERSQLKVEHNELKIEHNELKAQFSELKAAYGELSERVNESAHTLTLANADVERLRGLVDVQTGRLSASDHARAQAESELALIRRSRSWRLTYPLRAMKPFVRATCATTARVLVKLPGVRPLARRLLSRYPNIKQRLVVLMYGLPSIHGVPVSNVTNQASSTEGGTVNGAASDEFAGLSRSAIEALDSLKRHRKLEEKAR